MRARVRRTAHRDADVLDHSPDPGPLSPRRRRAREEALGLVRRDAQRLVRGEAIHPDVMEVLSLGAAHGRGHSQIGGTGLECALACGMWRVQPRALVIKVLDSGAPRRPHRSTRP